MENLVSKWIALLAINLTILTKVCFAAETTELNDWRDASYHFSHSKFPPEYFAKCRGMDGREALQTLIYDYVHGWCHPLRSNCDDLVDLATPVSSFERGSKESIQRAIAIIGAAHQVMQKTYPDYWGLKKSSDPEADFEQARWFPGLGSSFGRIRFGFLRLLSDIVGQYSATNAFLATLKIEERRNFFRSVQYFLAVPGIEPVRYPSFPSSIVHSAQIYSVPGANEINLLDDIFAKARKDLGIEQTAGSSKYVRRR